MTHETQALMYLLFLIRKELDDLIDDVNHGRFKALDSLVEMIELPSVIIQVKNI